MSTLPSPSAPIDLNELDTTGDIFKKAIAAINVTGFPVDAMTMEIERIEGVLLALECSFQGEAQPAQKYVAAVLNSVGNQVQMLRTLVIKSHDEYARMCKETRQ